MHDLFKLDPKFSFMGYRGVIHHSSTGAATLHDPIMVDTAGNPVRYSDRTEFRKICCKWATKQTGRAYSPPKPKKRKAKPTPPPALDEYDGPKPEPDSPAGLGMTTRQLEIVAGFINTVLTYRASDGAMPEYRADAEAMCARHGPLLRPVAAVIGFRHIK